MTKQLVTLWTATNNVDKRIWARQLQIDFDRTEEVEQGARDLQDREALQKRQEDQLAIAKEQKKNRAKYQDVLEEAPPITAPEIISSYAMTHLQKGQYVELWYFTNEGMAWGLNMGPVNKNALSQTVDSDGNVSWAPTTTAKAAKDVWKDRDLSWEQLLMATPRFLEAIQAADWTPQHQTMMHNLLAGLQSHPYQFTANPLDRRTLVRYLCEQRLLWHQSIKVAVGRGWNIGIISEPLLRMVKSTIRNEEADRREAERDLM
ncbi:hypothetical protein C0991_007294, partial [Blastosporella zonata]